MATFLDVSALSGFSSIFVFLFVWIAMFALMMYSHVFGGNKLLYATISFLVAVFVLMSPVATGMVAYIAPWTGILFLFLLLYNVVMKSFGQGLDTPSFSSVKYLFLVIFMMVVLIGGLNYVREHTGIAEIQDQIEKGDIDASKTSNVLLHPKMIGAIFVFLIAMFAVGMLVHSNN